LDAALAGQGNYLRAEILFDCRLDPWKIVADLSAAELECLCDAVPRVTLRAYSSGGITVTDELACACSAIAGSLIGRPAITARGTTSFAAPISQCLHCGGPIRQFRQVTHQSDEGDRTRITYFCPTCQNSQGDAALRPPRRQRRRNRQAAAEQARLVGRTTNGILDNREA
jgi:endonuclease-8